MCWLHLVHAGVGEEQRGVVVRHHGARLPEGMVMFVREERDERVADARRRPAVVGQFCHQKWTNIMRRVVKNLAKIGQRGAVGESYPPKLFFHRLLKMYEVVL